MKTQRIALTNQWQQLTDGTQTRILQLTECSFALAVSETQPDADDPYYLLTDLVTVGPPFKWWIRVLDREQSIVVTL
jgi:hypothetical protein